MAIIFTPGKHTADGKSTHIPHEGTVPQNKINRELNTRVVVPGYVGDDGLIVQPIKKEFWLRELLAARERETF